jgi:hypothetical protein
MPEHAATAGLLRWGQRANSGHERNNQKTARSTGRINRWLHELF